MKSLNPVEVRPMTRNDCWQAKGYQPFLLSFDRSDLSFCELPATAIRVLKNIIDLNKDKFIGDALERFLFNILTNR